LIGLHIAAQDCLRIISQEAEDHSIYWNNRAIQEHEDRDAHTYCRTMADRWHRLQSQLLLVADSLETGELIEPCAIINYPIPPSMFSYPPEQPSFQSKPGPAENSDPTPPVDPPPSRITVNFADGVPTSIQSSPEMPCADSSTQSEPSATLSLAEEGIR